MYLYIYIYIYIYSESKRKREGGHCRLWESVRESIREDIMASASEYVRRKDAASSAASA